MRKKYELLLIFSSRWTDGTELMNFNFAVHTLRQVMTAGVVKSDHVFMLRKCLICWLYFNALKEIVFTHIIWGVLSCGVRNWTESESMQIFSYFNEAMWQCDKQSWIITTGIWFAVFHIMIFHHQHFGNEHFEHLICFFVFLCHKPRCLGQYCTSTVNHKLQQSFRTSNNLVWLIFKDDRLWSRSRWDGWGLHAYDPSGKSAFSSCRRIRLAAYRSDSSGDVAVCALHHQLSRH